ncbi:MAG: transglycosylase SLT domain-containing protein [Prevotellaceae bacterium]|jgi:membrane-bound lytic murein transglycosylase F|nr:transglycosylase SLT domain-containing protein [Prevotellaceae bacterium]
MKGKFLLLAIAVFVFGITVKPNADENKKSIPANKELVVALDTCYYNYFLHKGNPSGYQLELFELFAGYKGVNLDFRIIPDSLKFDMLSTGKIDIAVFSEGLDSLHNVFNKYENICSSIPLDDSVKSVWLTVEDNLSLMFEINVWANKLKGEKIYNSLHIKYFRHKYNKTAKQISPYDNILKKYSAETGWDWRLATSIVCHESQFKPTVISKSGAAGLMQLMPNTVRSLDVKNVYNPEENIKGGMMLIAYLTDVFEKKGVAGDELVNFVLAAYNAGHGKIFNFMKETENAGLDKNKWSDVCSVILMKNKLASAPKSKFSGKETMKFVDNVLKYYKHYQNFFPVERNIALI